MYRALTVISCCIALLSLFARTMRANLETDGPSVMYESESKKTSRSFFYIYYYYYNHLTLSCSGDEVAGPCRKLKHHHHRKVTEVIPVMELFPASITA